MSVVFIGLGEAGLAFAAGLGVDAAGYDLKLPDPVKHADFARVGVRAAADTADAVVGASLILSVVTADQALAAARKVAATIPRGAIFADMNSVAPATKRAARDAIEAAGGRYADVAVMSPVHPAGRAVPLLVSGPHAAATIAALSALGFDPARADGPVGVASAIKMIRSVMVKGIEALTAECVLAAAAAGVAEPVLASLDANWPGADWTRRSDYNLDRMMLHGLRRAAEMEEVVVTLDDLGTGSDMARSTALRQRAIGRLGLVPPPGLAAKIDAIARAA